MSILNVNQLQPVGGGNTITVGSSNIDYSGSITGNISVDGNLTVTGVVSNEDVTNIDSVGVITARSGLQVTGGSIGIGTDNPSAPLHLSGADASNAKIKIEDNNNGFAASEINIANGGRDLRIAAPQDIYFEDVDNGEKYLYIESGGSIGIGTDNPSYLIDAHTSSGNAQLRIKSGGDLSQLILESTDTSGYSQINFADAGSSNIGMLQYFHNDNHMEFTVNESEALRIQSDGKISIGGDNNSYLYRSALNTWTFSFNSVDTLRLYEDTAWIMSNNITPNPNNTGSEIQGAMLRFGNNIWLQERYPNGAYSDRQDLVLNTDTGYGLGQSDKVRFTSGGSIELNQHHSSAATNSGRSSPSLKFKGYGWNTGSGSEEVGTQLQSQHAYWTNNYSSAYGQTYPDFKILIKNSDSATYDEKFAFSGNGVMRLQSGGGINFHNYGSGTGVSSNILDDYEEGTWTPNFTFNGNSTGLTYDYRGGVYTRIGRLVTCYCMIVLSNKGSSTGNVLVSGLPFTATDLVSATSIEGGGHAVYQDNTVGTHVGPIQAAVINSQSYFDLYRVTSTNPGHSDVVTNGNVANNSSYRFVLQYTAV